MASVDWETNTLETLGHQPQGLVTFARQSVIGEANFSSQDNEPIKSGPLVTFSDDIFFQGICDKHGTIMDDPSGRPLTDNSSPVLHIDQYLDCAILPGCSCMVCLLIGVPGNWIEGVCCRFKDCDFTTDIHAEYISHERDHYHGPGNPLFRCVEQHCRFVTKRWPDLIRHNTVRHCTKPKQFACPVPWCKYSGDNGFARKDKLRSHQRNVHQGDAMSVATSNFRPIQPAMPGGPGLAHQGMSGLGS